MTRAVATLPLMIGFQTLGGLSGCAGTESNDTSVTSLALSSLLAADDVYTTAEDTALVVPAPGTLTSIRTGTSSR